MGNSCSSTLELFCSAESRPCVSARMHSQEDASYGGHFIPQERHELAGQAMDDIGERLSEVSTLQRITINATAKFLIRGEGYALVASDEGAFRALIPDDLAEEVLLRSVQLGELTPDMARLFASTRITRLSFENCWSVSNELLSALLTRPNHDLRGSGSLLAQSVRQVSLVKSLRITNRGLQMLNLCPGLQSLTLRAFPDLDDDALGLRILPNLKNLRMLALPMCTNIGDQGINSLARPELLRHLDLSWCRKLTDASLKRLACSGLPQLVFLSLAYCANISDGSVMRLQCLRYLRFLNVAGCYQLTNVGLEMLLYNKSLTAVNLSHCSVSGRFIESLVSHSGLTNVDLSGIDFGDGTCSLHGKQLASVNLSRARCVRLDLVHNSYLTSLDVSYCLLSARDICRVLQGAPGLRRLFLTGCHQIVDEAFVTIVPHVSHLRVLHLAGTGISATTLESLSTLKDLEVLDLAATSLRVPDWSLLREMHALRALSLEDIEASLEFSCYPNLQSLTLIRSEVSAAGTVELAETQSLLSLDLSRCILADGTAIAKLCLLSKLHTLNLRGVLPTITDSELEEIAAMHSLIELNVSESAVTTSGVIGSLAGTLEKHKVIVSE